MDIWVIWITVGKWYPLTRLFPFSHRFHKVSQIRYSLGKAHWVRFAESIRSVWRLNRMPTSSFQTAHCPIGLRFAQRFGCVSQADCPCFHRPGSDIWSSIGGDPVRLKHRTGSCATSAPSEARRTPFFLSSSETGQSFCPGPWSWRARSRPKPGVRSCCPVFSRREPRRGLQPATASLPWRARPSGLRRENESRSQTRTQTPSTERERKIMTLRSMILGALLTLLLPDFASSTRGADIDRPLRIIVFGAHPDDCELDAGGTGCAVGQAWPSPSSS